MTTPTPNDVPALLLASFRTNRAEVIAPLVAMGWNASTTVTVARDATVFDDEEREALPMWTLASRAQAWAVLDAWMEAPHPKRDALLRDVGDEAGRAWFDGRYPLAQTLVQHLQRHDPAGHPARLQHALLALSDPGRRSLNTPPETPRETPRETTGDGLERWLRCGGDLSRVLEPFQKSRAERNVMDLAAASPLVRWLHAFDRSAIRVLDDHHLEWIPHAHPALDRLVLQWGQMASSNGYPTPAHAAFQERAMQDGLAILERLVRDAPMPVVGASYVEQALASIVTNCVVGHTWNGQAQTWAHTLSAAYEGRVLRDSTPSLAGSPPRDRPRL